MGKKEHFNNVKNNVIDNQHRYKENLKKVETKFLESRKTNKNNRIPVTILVF